LVLAAAVAVIHVVEPMLRPSLLLEAGVVVAWPVAQRSTTSTPRAHAEPIG
jgi:hypothetical protein